MQYMLHVGVFRSSVCSLSREEFGDRMLLLASVFSDPCNIFFTFYPFYQCNPGSSFASIANIGNMKKARSKKFPRCRKLNWENAGIQACPFCSRSFHEGNRTISLSQSLGTVSLDKPQILPYPCIKRETSPKLGILVFQGDFFTGSAKQI